MRIAARTRRRLQHSVARPVLLDFRSAGHLVRAYVAKGMCREALDQLQKYSSLRQGSAWLLGYGGYVYARCGDRSQALQVLGELKTISNQRYVPSTAMASVFAGLGDKEQAIAWLLKAYDERTSAIPYLNGEENWDTLRSDPRFQDLVKRAGLPQ